MSFAIAVVETVEPVLLASDQLASSPGSSSVVLTAINWSNVIRDSRNALHYGADAASRNTYEKVAALLLGANQNFRILYAIRRAATEFA
jgi:hypothetical protein